MSIASRPAWLGDTGLRPAGLLAAFTIAAPLLLAWPLAATAQIDEIVVTTRKKEESLQDVPIAVSAIGAETIQRQGIADLDDITKLTPSVQFDTSFGPQDTRITLRGLSNTRGRSNVAFLVDGIDVTTENLIIAGSGLLSNRRLLTDIERIEVIKGPQSALYGRAAFAGAIAYITKDPSDEFEGKVGIDAAEFGRMQVDASVEGPVWGIEDMLGLRLAGVWWEDDGFYDNSISGDDVGGTEGWGASLTAVFTPGDRVKVKMRMEYSDEKRDPNATVRIGGFLPEDDLSCPNIDNEYRPYPQNMLDAGILSGSNTATGLANFAPGFCLPKTFGDSRNKQIRHSENPLTGEDFPGSTLETFRMSLVGTFDLDAGTVSSYTGWTDFESSNYYDQDYQAVGRPDTLFAMQIADTMQTTDQFSQEVRFASNFDGPVNFTLGVLWWEEERRLRDQNVIISCLTSRKVGGVNGAIEFGVDDGLCDGTLGTVTTAQEYYFQLLPISEAPWEAIIEHLSFYGAIEWEISDAWTLSFENRWVDEDFDLLKPNFSSCANLAFWFATTRGGTFPREVRNANGDLVNDVLCDIDRVQQPGFVRNPTLPNDAWALIEGSESSHFNTPSAKLEWKPTDDSLIYFSWARAQKPGGINQLTAGGSAVNIDDERFDPEKMEAWELGTKFGMELGGDWQWDFALFFQDYTDKQIGTQVIDPATGVLQPRVINASAAEVWGLEMGALWLPEFLDGLVLNVQYTYLDAKYVDFLDQTRSGIRAAFVGECAAIATEIETQGTVDPTDDEFTDFCQLDFSGAPLERTPENAVVISAALQRPLTGTNFDWFAGLNATWQDERPLDVDGFLEFDSYWLVDARAGLEGDRWDILAYVDNVFNDKSIKSGGSGPDFGEQVTQLAFTAGLGVTHFFGTMPDQRIFGLRANYRF